MCCAPPICRCLVGQVRLSWGRTSLGRARETSTGSAGANNRTYSQGSYGPGPYQQYQVRQATHSHSPPPPHSWHPPLAGLAPTPISCVASSGPCQRSLPEDPSPTPCCAAPSEPSLTPCPSPPLRPSTTPLRPPTARRAGTAAPTATSPPTRPWATPPTGARATRLPGMPPTAAPRSRSWGPCPCNPTAPPWATCQVRPCVAPGSQPSSGWGPWSTSRCWVVRRDSAQPMARVARRCRPCLTRTVGRALVPLCTLPRAAAGMERSQSGSSLSSFSPVSYYERGTPTDTAGPRGGGAGRQHLGPKGGAHGPQQPHAHGTKLGALTRTLRTGPASSLRRARAHQSASTPPRSADCPCP